MSSYWRLQIWNMIHCYRVVLSSIPFHSCVFHLLLRTLAPTSISLFIFLLNLRTHSGSFRIAMLFTNDKLTKFKSFFSILYIFTQKIYNQNTVFIAMDCIFFSSMWLWYSFDTQFNVFISSEVVSGFHWHPRWLCYAWEYRKIEQDHHHKWQGLFEQRRR